MLSFILVLADTPIACRYNEKLDWQRVRVIYSEGLTPPRTCWLEVHSKPLVAVQQARRRAQMRLNDAKRKL